MGRIVSVTHEITRDESQKVFMGNLFVHIQPNSFWMCKCVLKPTFLEIRQGVQFVMNKKRIRSQTCLEKCYKNESCGNDISQWMEKCWSDFCLTDKLIKSAYRIFQKEITTRSRFPYIPHELSWNIKLTVRKQPNMHNAKRNTHALSYSRTMKISLK